MNLHSLTYGLLLTIILMALTPPSYASDISSENETIEKPASPTTQTCNEALIKQQMRHIVGIATTMQFNLDRYEKQVEYYYTNTLKTHKETFLQDNDMIKVNQTHRKTLFKDLTKARNYSNAFTCTNDKDIQLNQFKESMQTVKEDLTNYKKSIKAFITEVHKVSNDTKKK